MKFSNGMRKKHIRKSAIKKRLVFAFSIFFIMFIGIGYAYVRRTLNITNNTKISSLSWNLHFDNFSVTSGSITPLSETNVSDNNMKITTNLEFKNSGEFYEYTVDIVNDGTIDAMIESVEGLDLTAEQSKYFEYSATYSDGVAISQNQRLRGKTRETIKVRIALKDNILLSDLPTEILDLKFTLKLNYIQANNNAINVRNTLAIARQNEGVITQGDVVTFSFDNTQKFYVLNSNATETVLFAKEALTSEVELGTDFYQYSLANSAYWKNRVGDGHDYSGSYAGTPNYPYVYDQNSSVYDLLERYNSKLKSLGINITSTRLVSYEELQGLSNDIIRGFDYTYTYITGSAYDDDSYWIMSSDGTLGQSLVSLHDTFAIRPVIVVPTSEF